MKGLEVVNANAECGDTLVESYNRVSTKDKEQLQFLSIDASTQMLQGTAYLWRRSERNGGVEAATVQHASVGAELCPQQLCHDTAGAL